MIGESLFHSNEIGPEAATKTELFVPDKLNNPVNIVGHCSFILQRYHEEETKNQPMVMMMTSHVFRFIVLFGIDSTVSKVSFFNRKMQD
jgi:hypothetical protein